MNAITEHRPATPADEIERVIDIQLAAIAEREQRLAARRRALVSTLRGLEAARIAEAARHREEMAAIARAEQETTEQARADDYHDQMMIDASRAWLAAVQGKRP